MNKSLLNEHQLESLGNQLDKGIVALELKVEDNKRQKLLAYLQLFHKWNRTYNLSAVREPEVMVHRHLLDSLAIASHITGDNFIDVGTGGGLPGIPLAILFPERQFTLLDSAGKKTRFLFQVKTSLGLTNVQVENRRVESFQPEQLFDGVISRAFASLEDMVSGCNHLLDDDGLFWAMKGQYPEAELSVLEKHYKVVEALRLEVPGGDGERHLMVLKQDRPR